MERILFLQLPQLDNDARGRHENVHLAENLLTHALRHSPLTRGSEPIGLPPEADNLDDRALLRLIGEAQPALLAATAYVWNVERTLALLRRAQSETPGLRIIMGGPEACRGNGLLVESGVPDIIVEGEGEALLPAVVAGLRGGAPLEAARIGVRGRNGYTWGNALPETPDLRAILPPPEDPQNRPDGDGMAYLEAARGCPLRCTYCCYNQRRRGVSFLPPEDVLRRIEVLRERGAREIRFIDPTFNSHPAFDELIDGIAQLNRRGGLSFFAELRAETITPDQACRLARGGFTEIEVGVQSLDPAVLKAIRRPTRLDALRHGVAALAEEGIRLTVDIMAGLPLQTAEDIRRSLDWAAAVPNGRVQFMHTLMLPGTELRETWGARLAWMRRPPYRVTGTPWLGPDALSEAQAYAEQLTGQAMDAPTERFVGKRLPDLFAERVRVTLDGGPLPDPLPGCASRRALVVEADDFYGRRQALTALVRKAVRQEPHALWQFVLRPRYEEPLDVLDGLVREVRRLPVHTLDRMVIPRRAGQRAARRVMLWLRADGRYDPAWQQAAEDLLAESFF